MAYLSGFAAQRGVRADDNGFRAPGGGPAPLGGQRRVRKEEEEEAVVVVGTRFLLVSWEQRRMVMTHARPHDSTTRRDSRL